MLKNAWIDGDFFYSKANNAQFTILFPAEFDRERGKKSKI